MTRYIVPKEGIHSREVDDRLLVLHIPTSRYVELNASAVALWTTVRSGATQLELREVLVNRYGITPDQAATDVSAFLAQLIDTGLVATEE